MSVRTLDPLRIDLNGMQLIEASAGTGKTYTITTLFLRLLLETPMDVGRILVVTFTDAAAAELKARIRSRMMDVLKAYRAEDFSDPLVAHLFREEGDVKEKRLIAALREFDAAEIVTIHSFLKRVLGEHAFECRVAFDSELVTDQAALFDEMVHDFYAKEVADASSLFLTYLETEKHGPGRFMHLADKAVRIRHVTVLPRLEDVEQVPDPGPVFETAFSFARDLFSTYGDDFEDYLETHKGLNRRVYSKRWLPKWFDILRAYLSNPVPVLPVPEQLARFTSQALEPGHDKPPVNHPMLEGVDRLAGAAQGFERAFVAMKRRFLDEAYRAMEAVKQEKEVHTFDDLILRVDESLRRGDGLKRSIRQRLDAVLIDEFQDTDPVQYRIFNTLFSDGAPFVIIGDPKQSIYGFRGADIFTYLSAAKQVGERRSTLPVNWRSDPGLIQAVNTVFSETPAPFYFDDIHFEPVLPRDGVLDRFEIAPRSAPLEIRFIERLGQGTKPMQSGISDFYLPGWVAKDIVALLQETDREGAPIRPSQIAVLVSTNRQAENVLAALEKIGLQGVLFGAHSVFQSKEAVEMLTVMAAIDDPGHLGKLTAALATRIVGFDAATIAGLDQDGARLEACVAKFAALRRAWDDSGFIEMWSRLLDDDTLPSDRNPIGSTILKCPDGERAMTNLRHLAELLERHRSVALCGRRALLHWLTARISDTRAASDDAEIRLESDAESVRIITVHKSKGLEFDVVYCPYLFDGLGAAGAPSVFFHHPEKGRAAYLDLGSDSIKENRDVALEEELAERLRLAYVALTRARHKTIVVHGAFTNMESSPLAYLFHHGGERHTLSSLRKRVRTLDDNAMTAEIDALAQKAGGAILRTTLCSDGVASSRAPLAEPSLACREMSRPVPFGWCTTSFTDLVRHGSDAAEPVWEFDELDPVDFGAPLDTPLSMSKPKRDKRNAAPAGDAPQLAFSFETPTVPLVSEPADLPIIGLERGARAGTMLHAVFEESDFQKCDSEIIAAVLDQYGFEPVWQEPVTEMLSVVLDTILCDRTGLRLKMISPKKRLNELAFLFPVAPREMDSPRLFHALGELLQHHGTPIPAGYASRLSEMDHPLETGYLKGFIDLVFEYRGRYYIVDYKSNYLGDEEADYGAESLKASMAEHHYYVQYLIYTVALYRFLKLRIPGRDFSDLFGGVYYLFIRGMSGEVSAPKYGVFYDKPALPLIEAVDRLLVHMEEGR